MSEIQKLNVTPNDAIANTLNYNDGTILYEIRVDKYTSEVKEHFVIENSATKQKFKINKNSMLTLAELSNKEVFSLLLNNGWEGSDKMKAGTGVAVKMTKKADAYNCIFFIGELGKQFDDKKIANRNFIKLNKGHLEAIFTFLIMNEKAVATKNEELKRMKTTLDLVE